jgi:hypothetical protein
MFDERPDIDFLFDGTFAEAVNYSVAIAILVAGGLSILFFFFGGIQFITSGGDEEKSKKAVVTIRYSIIGLLVVIFSVTFVSLFWSHLQSQHYGTASLGHHCRIDSRNE